jgi:peptidyl-prolyl cis-trans isomerase SurA
MKSSLLPSILLFLPLVGLGCNAAMNPPKVPGKTVAPTVKLLWSEPNQEIIKKESGLSSQQGQDLGLNKGIVATVDQNAITLKEFDAAFYRALKKKPWNLSEEDLYHRVLNDLVINKLLLIYGEKLEEVEATDFEVDMEMERVSAQHPEGWEGYRRMLNMESLSLLDIREQIKESLLLKKVQGYIFRGMGSPSPQEIKDEYEKKKSEFFTDDERDVSLIIVFNDTYAGEKQKLDELLERISKSIKERPFDEIAKKFSEGPKADEGGRQGWIKKEALAPELSKVAFNLTKGEKSGPHITKDFSFFISCHDAKHASSKEMNEVQSYLENSVQNQKRAKLMETKIKELYELHHVQELSPQDYLKYRSGLKP